MATFIPFSNAIIFFLSGKQLDFGVKFNSILLFSNKTILKQRFILTPPPPPSRLVGRMRTAAAATPSAISYQGRMIVEEAKRWFVQSASFVVK